METTAATETQTDVATPAATVTPAPSATAATVTPAPSTPAATVTPAPSATAAPDPTPTPSPTPHPYAETPDQAGTGGLLFDIYKQRALVDLNQDGQLETIEFLAGHHSNELIINGISYTIDWFYLGQCFAITRIDQNQPHLEIVLTQRYEELADTELGTSLFFWWDGASLRPMGHLAALKFDGPWRGQLDPNQYLDGHGQLMTFSSNNELTYVSFQGRYRLSGPDRIIEAIAYPATPTWHIPELIAKHPIALLKERDDQYFLPAYAALWDHVSALYLNDRNYEDAIVSFIPQPGETLQVVTVYGQNWFLLRAADGKQGWLKSVALQVQGYAQVMGYDAFDLFDGIVVAG